MANNWDKLLTDVLVEIAKRIRMCEDYVAFRGVCTCWRSAATKDNFMFRNFPVPLLMRAPRKGHVLDFLNLTKGIVNQVSLSEPPMGKRFYSSKGCLITIDQGLNVNLMHPFSNLQHKFPNMMTLHNDSPLMYDFLITKCALSSNPLLEPDYILMVIYRTRTLIYARPGDETWTKLAYHGYGYCDLTYYEGRIYAVSCTGEIWAWDYKVGGVDNPSEKELVAKLLSIKLPPNRPGRTYIVESAGALLIIVKYIHYDRREVYTKYRSCEFVVFILDSSTRTCTEIKDLGDRIIFLGHNSSFVSSHLPNCKPNSIYFTDNWKEGYDGNEEGGGKDTGIYSLQDGSITFTTHFSHKSFNLINPPLWIEERSN
ncbi:hypothetical protein LWI29_003887 [Acer saccharum]|uniref:KIB1-4 beta-propeller domain-containing protein n=1 Tax=Acer saccharum TaxID=4024 RepID=A0AA39VY67_ACESA|nr:hypothetical protein LWI29_003887 [Acer saccharum]